MRNYKKKRVAKNPELLKQAAEAAISDKRSIRTVAKEFGVCHATLGRFVKRVGERCRKIHSREDVSQTIEDVHLEMRTCKQLFTPAQEKSLVRFMKKHSEDGSSRTHKDMRKLAFEFAENNGADMPASWFINKMAGTDWLHCFLKRNPSCMTSKPEDPINNAAVCSSNLDAEEDGEYLTGRPTAQTVLYCPGSEVPSKTISHWRRSNSQSKQQKREMELAQSFLTAVQSLDSEEAEAENPDNYCTSQMKSLYEMQKKNRFCDYSFFVPHAGTERGKPTVIRAHRCVFAAASEKIDRCRGSIFNAGSEITDEAVQNVVEFTYTGTISNVLKFSAHEILKICQAAVTIGVEKCARYLVKQRPDLLPEIIAMNPLFWNAEFPWVDPV